jgi:hypothetical protein
MPGAGAIHPICSGSIVLKKSDVGSGGPFSRVSLKIGINDINDLTRSSRPEIRSKVVEIAVAGLFQHNRPTADVQPTRSNILEPPIAAVRAGRFAKASKCRSRQLLHLLHRGMGG